MLKIPKTIMTIPNIVIKKPEILFVWCCIAVKILKITEPKIKLATVVLKLRTAFIRIDKHSVITEIKAAIEIITKEKTLSCL